MAAAEIPGTAIFQINPRIIREFCVFLPEKSFSNDRQTIKADKMTNSGKRHIFHRCGWLVPAIGLLVYACANRGYPEGGPKDETPPEVVAEQPASFSTDFKAKRVNIHFNEFVQLKEINDKFIFSPPVKKDPKVSLKGKYVQIAIPDSLRPNTTYSMDFADAIVDNNEGNPLGFYRYVFSTGTVIDTLELSGNVVNAESGEPMMGLLVALYERLGDSVPLRELPDYIARTDSAGFFRVTNLREADYRVAAIEDANRDKMYTPEAEGFAWLDSTVHPVVIPVTQTDTFRLVERIEGLDTLMRDSIVTRNLLAYGPGNLYLRVFQEKPTQLYLVDDERKERERLNFTFSIPGENGFRAELWDTLAREPLPEDWYFKEENPTHDTITLWIKDSTVYKRDTLHFILHYLRSDSTGQHTVYADTSRYTFTEKKSKEGGNARKREGEKEKTPFLDIRPNVTAELELGTRFALEFDRPIDKSTLDSVRLSVKSDTLWVPVPFRLTEDSAKVRRVFLDAEWKQGSEYKLDIDSASVFDIYGRFNNKLEKKFKVKTEEQYGKIILQVSGVTMPTVVQLYRSENGKSENGKRKYGIVREKRIDSDGETVFELLKEGKYKFRAILDANGNGIWDTGLYLKKRQPEEIIYLPVEISVRPNFDIEQTFDLKGTGESSGEAQKK